jgi:hypothetical protein
MVLSAKKLLKEGKTKEGGVLLLHTEAYLKQSFN